jgi:hypothetical protein
LRLCFFLGGFGGRIGFFGEGRRRANCERDGASKGEKSRLGKESATGEALLRKISDGLGKK